MLAPFRLILAGLCLLFLFSSCAPQKSGGMSMPRKVRKKCNCPKWTQNKLPPRTFQIERHV